MNCPINVFDFKFLFVRCSQFLLKLVLNYFVDTNIVV